MRVAASFVILCTLLSGALSFGATDSDPNYILCKLGPSVRTVRIVVDPGNGCQDVYTKSGIDKTVGKAHYMKSCHTILDNIRANLEKASWKCRDISHATVVEDNSADSK